MNKNLPIKKIRYIWSRKPIETPHSTKKGKKGYNRKKFKKDIGVDSSEG